MKNRLVRAVVSPVVAVSLFAGAPAFSQNVPGTGVMDAAPAPYPSMEDPNLQVSTLYDDPGLSASTNNLTTPIGMAFLPTYGGGYKYDILVIEKNTGKVRRIRTLADGTLVNAGTPEAPNTAPVVLDLAVNNFSERGLLGIAVHPYMKPSGGKVYLAFTERTAENPLFNPSVAESITNPKYLRNTPNSNTDDDVSQTIVNGPDVPALGADTSLTAGNIVGPQTPLLGQRVASFRWDPLANGGIGALTFDRTIIRTRSFQNDRNQRVTSDVTVWNRTFNGNHMGGKITFGRDGKLYVMIGDVGRRGLMQNVSTPLGIDINGNLTGKDDVFGGPVPDNAHLTGVILRLNDDGSAPLNNPFYFWAGFEALRLGYLYSLSDATRSEVRANLRKVYSYGIRNGFGLAVDPYGRRLWSAENSGKAFEEINRVKSGFNGGWVQIMGPSSRMDPNPNNTLGDPFFPPQSVGGIGGYPSLYPDQLTPVSLPPMGDFKMIEVLYGLGRSQSPNAGGGAALLNTTTGPRGLQQPRFLAAPSPLFPNSQSLADSRDEALSRLYLFPGARYVDPALSVKNAVPNAGLGFIRGKSLGLEYRGDLVFGSGVARQGASTAFSTANPPVGVVPTNGYEDTPYFYPWLLTNAFTRPEDANSTSNYGHLYRMQLSSDRRELKFSDPNLEDKVVDNRGVDDWKAEQGSLLFGRNFGIGTDIVTGPDGNLFVVSITRLLSGGGSALGNQSATGRIYMISKRPPSPYAALENDEYDAPDEND